MKTNSPIFKSAGRKTIILLLLGSVAMGAFATLGDGKNSKSNPRKLLTNKVGSKPGSFSLRSGYNFRGSQVIKSQENTFINLNTLVTYQKGNTTYTFPMQKKVILNNKVIFNPNAATR